MNRSEIFAAIEAERQRQDAKWGGANHDMMHTDAAHPVGLELSSSAAARVAAVHGIVTEDGAKTLLNDAEHGDGASWAHIAIEHMAKVIARATYARWSEMESAALDAALVKLAAVIVAWIEGRAVARRVRAEAEQQFAELRARRGDR